MYFLLHYIGSLVFDKPAIFILLYRFHIPFLQCRIIDVNIIFLWSNTFLEDLLQEQYIGVEQFLDENSMSVRYAQFNVYRNDTIRVLPQM